MLLTGVGGVGGASEGLLRLWKYCGFGCWLQKSARLVKIHQAEQLWFLYLRVYFNKRFKKKTVTRWITYTQQTSLHNVEKKLLKIIYQDIKYTSIKKNYELVKVHIVKSWNLQTTASEALRPPVQQPASNQPRPPNRWAWRQALHPQSSLETDCSPSWQFAGKQRPWTRTL